MKPFIHLRNHSHFSLLEGLSKIPAMVNKAKEFGFESLALTDHGNMYGAIEFYRTCKAKDIKPLIGVEIYIAPGSRHDKRARIDADRDHLTLLAKNEAGYRKLIKLVSKTYLEGFYYKPRADEELLKEFAGDLICLSGDFRGEIYKLVAQDKMDEATRAAHELESIYGKDNFYLEISHHPNIEGNVETNKKIYELSKKIKIPIVATQGAYYLEKDDKPAHRTLLGIQNTATRVEQTFINSDDFSFIDTEVANKYYEDFPEALENTKVVADACNLEINLSEWIFPNFEIPKGSTYEDELRKLAYDGIKNRGKVETDELKERIEYELGVINKKGYAVYFLVVADLLRFAKEKGIYTNIRGSVAGSMVSYLTEITKLDPFEYKLFFERFLNPDRPSSPDIDMDFADNRRDEVIDYARAKYGDDHVAQIGTFGKMLARGVVRDVARSLGHPYNIGDTIARLIPMGSQGFPMTIERALKEDPDLKKAYETDEDTKEIIDLGRKLEGCARHIGVHAAGVVITPNPLTDYVPIQPDPKGGKIITQYDMYSIDPNAANEVIGLLKFDFLGIKNLSILADSVDRVRAIRGIEIDIERIPIDDKKTFEMLSRGETFGTFQLNGDGMTRFLIDLKPSTIHDINAMVALYRPGPMEFIPEYIRRKHNPELVDYPHPLLEEDLKNSYGLLIYQEDVMNTAIKLAGYNWLQADKFRKAMGKKIPALMAEQEEKFKNGCVKNGIPKKTANDLWERIKPFAAYAFNKAHSASYGRVSYQTSYMKANFPQEYMTAIMTADSGDVEKISESVEECKRLGFEVLPPDINESFTAFTVVRGENKEVTNKIRFGLGSIKNFGEEIGKAIFIERRQNGQYKDYSDFLTRVQHKNLTKKSLESLIKCGAMDRFADRGVLLANMEEALNFNKNISNEESKNQESLFKLGDTDFKPNEFTLKKAEPASMGDKLLWEKELLGLYVSGHPLDKFKNKFENHDHKLSKVMEMKEGSQVLVAGMFEEAKTIMTKKGSKMAFAKLRDFSGALEVVIFPETYQNFKDLIFPDKCVAVRGTVSHRNGSPSVIADKIKEL